MCHGMCVEVTEKPWVSTSSPFLKKIYFELQMYLCVSVCGYMPVSAVSADFRRGCWSPRTRVTSNCEPSDMGTGNRTLEGQCAALTTVSSSSCSLCIWGKISLVVCHCAVCPRHRFPRDLDVLTVHLSHCGSTGITDTPSFLALNRF